MAKARFTASFSDLINDMLTKLSDDQKITKTEVLRRALALYEYVHQETQAPRSGEHEGAGEERLRLGLVDKKGVLKKEIVPL